MPVDPGDPRVYFAAERTLLAWIRTGVAVMAFGFVVARFGLFLRLLRAGNPAVEGSGLSPVLGTTLVLLGSLSVGGGALAYHRYCKRLRPADLPDGKPPLLPALFAWTLVALGFLVTVVLFA
jgi:putative membrane protein